jgi:hypothetical protein
LGRGGRRSESGRPDSLIAPAVYPAPISGNPLAVGVANPDDAETTGVWSTGGSPGFTWVTADAAG